MVSSIIVVKAESTNVYVNQGIEKSLFDGVKDNEYILYLWTNNNTVVIGKNQNAYSEVNVPLLQKEGGFVARRLSGGGAVFHDLGNVNFTFISKRENFSLDKNRNIILNALKKLGIDAYLTGRNDIEVDGCKVSGNAYYKNKENEFHHGTMLITSLKDKVARYLTPPSIKFSGKSVQSVKSRVASLNEFKEVNKEDFIKAIVEAFEEEFSLKAEEISSKKIMNSYTSFFANEEFIYGKKIEYKYSTKFIEDGKKYEIVFDIDNGKVSKCEVYTDSLDFQDAEKLYQRIYKTSIEEDNSLMQTIKGAIYD